MALFCPKCLADMNEIVVEGVTIDVCSGCKGIWLDPGELAMLRRAETDLPGSSEQLASGPRFLETTTYICPRCEGGFESFEYAPGTGLIIDRCQSCRGIYLDPGELKKVRTVTDSQRRMGLTSPEDTDARLRDVMRAEKKRPRNLSGGGSSTGVYFFQLLTGLPVEVDAPRQRFPYVVLALILVCAGAWVAQLVYMGSSAGQQMAFFQLWGFTPGRYEFGSLEGWQGLLTGMFVHGGWLHLLANMYFLWLFGNNVEDRMNRAVFVVFYLVCGLAAFAVHGALTAHPGIPTVGASGAISGVMGAYLVLYPHRQMYQILWFIQFKVSVVFYLLVWLGIQILFSGMGDGGVAWFAHIGGFVVGSSGLWLLKRAGMVRPDPFAVQAG